jgi:hypothetical protein
MNQRQLPLSAVLLTRIEAIYRAYLITIPVLLKSDIKGEMSIMDYKLSYDAPIYCLGNFSLVLFTNLLTINNKAPISYGFIVYPIVYPLKVVVVV